MVKKLVIAIIILALAAATGVLLYDRFGPAAAGPVPKDVMQQIDFSPFVVGADAKGYQSKSYKYAPMEDGTKVLSFIVTVPNGTPVTVSEYTQPPQFTEVTDYKAKFLENKSEDTAQTDNGVIYLFHPEKKQDIQVGMMLEKGLIVFFNPEKNLSKDDWRNLGNNLTVQRVKN